MPQCIKCKCYLPPHFVDHTDDGKERECVFCKKGTNEIKYGKNEEKMITKAETIKEYDIFLKSVKRENDILRKVSKGKGDIPTNLILK
jgi:hypothetical protein